MVKKQIVQTSLLLAFFVTAGIAEVIVNAKLTQTSPGDDWNPPTFSFSGNIENKTNKVFELGGYRVITTGGAIKYTQVYGGADVIVSDTYNGNFRHNWQMLSNALGWATKFNPSATISPQYNTNVTWEKGDTAIKIIDKYVLIKHGGAAIPDKPVEADPILLEDVDSIRQNISTRHTYDHDYYDTDYRYKDSLGVNGGKYSGGFLDTWFGKTQIQFPEKTEDFVISNTNVNFDANSTGGPMYWMALSAVQEVINVDMQWMASFGGKETMAGLGGAAVYNGTNMEGAYGCFEVEAATGTDRAITYYMYYPEYPGLAGAADVTTSGVDMHVFMKDYLGETETPINSAYVVNSAIMSATNLYGLYAVLSYNSDYYFKETLDGAADPYLALAAIAPAYNLGGEAHKTIWAPFNAGNWVATKADPNGRDLFPEGNSSYRSALLKNAQMLTNASAAAVSDLTKPLWDYQIPWSDVERFFLGDGGTVETQGQGGLLKHFVIHNSNNTQAQIDSIKNVRQGIMDTLQAGFNILKGKAPMTNGTDNISFRYDWLTLLRLMKQHINNDRFYDKPAGGDLLKYANDNSATIGANDTTYPHGDITVDSYDDVSFEATITGEDNIKVYSAQWTIKSDWEDWTPAPVKSGGTDQKKQFEVSIPKQQITSVYGEATGTLWYMVTDSMGNTIIRDAVIKGSPLKSAAAIDSDGDGKADSIHVHIIEAALFSDSGDVANTPDQFKFNWPNQSPLEPVSGATYNNEMFTFSPSAGNDDGSGLGKVEILYPSMENVPASKDIVDSIGPAINSDVSIGVAIPDGETGNTKIILKFTEDVTDIASSGLYLAFKKDGTTDSVAVTASTITDSSGFYVFELSYDSIKDYNMVKIVSTSTLKDAVGNSAATYNHWVSFEFEGDDDAKWNIAYIKDTDGDGIGDQITYKITLGNGQNKFTFDHLDDLFHKMETADFVAVDMDSVSINSSKDVATVKIDPADAGNYKGPDDGSGKIALTNGTLPDTLKGDIIDSVGPAIISAEFKEEDSTLTVVLTEGIEDISGDASKGYLKVGTTTLGQTSITQGANSATWTFKLTSVLSMGDMLSLIHNTGIVDESAQNNPPLESNQVVEVTIFSKLAKVKSLVFKDVKADGKMDNVKIVLNNEPEDIAALTFWLTWLDADGNLDTIEISGSDLDATSLPNEFNYNILSSQSIKADLTFVADSSSYGEITVIQKKSDSDELDTTFNGDAIKVDSMAPVLISAEYYDYKASTKKNELKVTFTEEVVITSSIILGAKPFDFFDSDNNKYELTLDLNYEQYQDQSSDFVPSDVLEFFVTSGTTPTNGDSLNVDAAEKDIVGNDENVQDNPNNKKIALSVFSAIGILNASYHDITTQRDGYIDEIRVRTDSEVPEELFDSLAVKIVLNGGRNFEALTASNFSSFTSDSSTGFIISVKQADGTDLNTSVSSSLDKLEISSEVKTSAGFIMNGSYGISDSIAPVIVSAVLTPVEITEDNYQDLLPDTLKITYSEAVDYASMDDSPLKFKKSDGSSLNVDHTKLIADAGNFVRYIVDYNSEKPKENDSVQIDINGTVSDNSSIMQQEDNVFVPFFVDPVPFHWNIGVYPNPVLKNSDEQVNEKKKNLATYLGISEDDIEKGMQAIVLDPLGPAPAASSVEISITIYDALGHRIVDDEKLKVSGDGEIWYFLWDGQNKKGRDVGSGIYLGYIKISPEELGVISDPLKLGVGQ